MNQFIWNVSIGKSIEPESRQMVPGTVEWIDGEDHQMGAKFLLGNEQDLKLVVLMIN